MTRKTEGVKGLARIGRNLRRALSRRLLQLWTAPAGELRKNPATSLLAAASRVYEKGLEIDQERARAIRATLPAYVISVGNITAGGTGKTPLVLWLCRRLDREGFHPAILSRGYGGKGKDPARVSPAGETHRLSAQFGDEPVHMAASLPSVPVWVGRNRLLSGRAALLENPRVDTLVLDDGFQHLALGRDLDIVLLDCRNPFGNGRTLPLGPLREPIESLDRCDAIVLTHADKESDLDKTLSILHRFRPGKPLFSCRHRICGFRPGTGGPAAPPEMLRGRRAASFAGIAGAEGFFRGLSECGIEIVAEFAFPDHYRYVESDLSQIVEAAARNRAELILTTAKDAVRLPPAYREPVLIAEMELDFGSDEERFRDFILGARNSCRRSGLAGGPGAYANLPGK